MRRLILISICLIVLSAVGQSNRRRLLLSDRNRESSGFSPNQIQGMAYFWNYNSITQGIVVAWPDDIQGYPFGNTVILQHPTNTSSGVYFQGNNAQRITLTNAVGVVVNSNFSFWVAFKMDGSSTTAYQTLMTSNNADGFWLHSFPPLDTTYSTPTDHRFGGFVTTNGVYDVVWAHGTSYTNGVATTTNTVGKTSDQRFTKIGDDGAGDQFGGWIKFIGIWTNKAITATDVTNLHTWALAH